VAVLLKTIAAGVVERIAPAADDGEQFVAGVEPSSTFD
jgi:hypothetical protein